VGGGDDKLGRVLFCLGESGPKMELSLADKERRGGMNMV
jgi:hypothetical protein